MDYNGSNARAHLDQEPTLELFERLALALAIGFLVGVERGWRSRDVAEGGRTAGLRTYALTGLLGGVAALLAQVLGGWALAAVALPLAAAFIVFTLREEAGEGGYSVTGVVAAILVFALGAYAVVGDWRLSAAAAVATTALLAFKPVLHSWLKRLTWPELRSALILLAMTLVALPLLPDRDLGPYGMFNPHRLWVITILIAGVSFAAYVAVKTIGPTRGVFLAAAAGAMISSTAVTLYLARRTREAPSAVVTHAGAALLAGAIMAARMLVMVAVVAPPLVGHVGPPLGVFAGLQLLAASLAGLRGGAGAAQAPPAPMKSPFELVTVLKFAVLLGVIMAAAKALSAIYGAAGLLPVAAIGGLADVDAVTLTSASMAAQGLDLHVCAAAVLLAGAVNSASKAVLSAGLGGAALGLLFGGGSLLAFAAAAFTWWVL
jgi:uncharacterized membrane protein (DUF4010 family)